MRYHVDTKARPRTGNWTGQCQDMCLNRQLDSSMRILPILCSECEGRVAWAFGKSICHHLDCFQSIPTSSFLCYDWHIAKPDQTLEYSWTLSYSHRLNSGLNFDVRIGVATIQSTLSSPTSLFSSICGMTLVTGWDRACNYCNNKKLIHKLTHVSWTANILFISHSSSS